MSRRFSPTKWQLVYENVQASGLFHEKYELERIGQEVTFDDEVEERLAQMTESTEAALRVSHYSEEERQRILLAVKWLKEIHKNIATFKRNSL